MTSAPACSAPLSTDVAVIGAGYIGAELVEQVVLRGNGDHRHVLVNQCQRAVFEFARRITFGMDIADFFELQRTL